MSHTTIDDEDLFEQLQHLPDDRPDGVAVEPTVPYAPGVPIPWLAPEMSETMPTEGILHAYMHVATLTHCSPPEWALGSALAAFGYEVSTRGFKIGGYRQLPTQFVMLVGGSGHGKSTAMKHAELFYKDYLARRGRSDEEAFVNLEGSSSGVFHRLMALYRHDMNMSPGILWSDEVTKFMKSNESSVGELLQQLWDGTTIERHLREFQRQLPNGGGAPGARVGATAQGKAPRLINPTCSAVLGTTPGGIESVTRAYWERGGLFARFLWLVGPEKVTREFRTSPRHAERTAALQEWESWSAWALGVEASRGPDAMVVKNTPRVNANLALFFDRWTAMMNAEDEAMRGPYARAFDHVQRISALYALSRCDTLVCMDDLQRAIQLIERALKKQKVLYGQTLGVPAYKLQERALTKIRDAAEEGLTRSDLYRQLQVASRDVTDAIDGLLARDEIVVIEERNGTRGRPTMRLYTVRNRPGARPATVIPFPRPGEADKSSNGMSHDAPPDATPPHE